YPKDSPFDLEAYTNSDYAGASLDRKSTTRGCQFLRRRLISWQCKKQTIVANSTTEAEYVAASSCCGLRNIHQECLEWNGKVVKDESEISTGNGRRATKDKEIIHKHLHAVLDKLMEYGCHSTLKGCWGIA
ncbi:hypothetical protein Tco_0783403, partial [Tanacetum coccineum]